MPFLASGEALVFRGEAPAGPELRAPHGHKCPPQAHDRAASQSALSTSRDALVRRVFRARASAASARRLLPVPSSLPSFPTEGFTPAGGIRTGRVREVKSPGSRPVPIRAQRNPQSKSL